MIQPTAVHMVLLGNDPSWTDTGIHVCRGDRVTRHWSSVARIGSHHVVG
jgi:hypothetical protein